MGVQTAPVHRRGFISLRGVTKSYKTGAGEVAVLKGVDLDFERGEFVAIIGKSGSGKSTLINMLTGIDRPTAGEVWVGDTPVHTLSEGQMAVWRGRNLGIVFQFFQLLPMLSLVENVMLPMDFCNMYSTRQRRERAMRLLELVDMSEHAHKLPSALSGGQQQRVAIARALANDPPVIVADEPTGNLDSKTAEAVFALFQQLTAQGKTLIMVTHDSSLAQRAGRTVLIADGEIVNEYVARALPTLTHQQMLHATRRLKPMHFPAGATILQEDTHGDHFFIVTGGTANVFLRRPGASDVMVASYGPGQYFGEIEALRGGKWRATIRAAPDTPVDVVALDRETFVQLLAESDATRQIIEQVVQSRLAENVASRL
ncbi:MAG: ATP-binding cassette domain-containing protein [Anaerolineae bacterium]|nr:ATP-binding cassette domain-containing protein [Thermoflexales bacterium]MDW8407957.1 ATP-binding cassette domain-containing protein [Anaerolineae bacterium]